MKREMQRPPWSHSGSGGVAFVTCNGERHNRGSNPFDGIDAPCRFCVRENGHTLREDRSITDAVAALAA